MTARRVLRSRAKGWRMPEDTVYVGRPTRWGNPFPAEQYGAARAVAEYAAWIETQPELRDVARTQLRGKNLACWCPPGAPCHADVLLTIANTDTDTDHGASTTASGPALAAFALAYAIAGLPVVPLFEPDARGGCSCGKADCRRPGKHPRNRGGLTGASTDPDTVAGWWRRWPGANIGGLTGVVFDVCDVDSAEGIAAVTPLLGACHGVAPLVRTGSGGWHLLFHPTGLGNRTRFLPGTDWRGQGGYVVLPPSLHATGTRYTFVRQVEGELPQVPPALRAALTPAAPAAPRANLPPPVARRTGYGPAALAREAEQVATAPQGARNHALNRAAFNLGQLIAAGHLTEADAITELTRAAARAGLEQGETARTIASGLAAGTRHPRTTRTERRAA